MKIAEVETPIAPMAMPARGVVKLRAPLMSETRSSQYPRSNGLNSLTGDGRWRPDTGQALRHWEVIAPEQGLGSTTFRTPAVRPVAHRFEITLSKNWT